MGGANLRRVNAQSSRPIVLTWRSVCSAPSCALGSTPPQNHHQRGLLRSGRQQHADVADADPVSASGGARASPSSAEINGAMKKLRIRCGCSKSSAAPIFPLCPAQNSRSCAPAQRRNLATTIRKSCLCRRMGRALVARGVRCSATSGRHSRRPKPADEDAAHFLIRMVHKYPNEVTIYEGGPMTNLALAISIDPAFSGTGAGVGLHGWRPEPAHATIQSS